MNRRDFVKFLALTAAGAAVPEQIKAFERYYEVNTPIGSDLVAVDEIWVCGMATKSMPTDIEIVCCGEYRFVLGINLFGGILRWVAAPKSELLGPADELSWRFSSNTAGFSMSDMRAQMSYIDQTGLRHYKILTEKKGKLGPSHNS